MKKSLKKALIMMLSIAMVFTYMAMPVYADDFTDDISEEAVQEVVLDDENQEPIAEPVPAEETVSDAVDDQLEETETIVSEEETKADGDNSALDAAELADGTYSIPGLKTAVLSMYHFDSETARVVIKGDDAWLITEIDGTKEASTLDRFNGMAYGKQSVILDPADETNHTLVDGTPVAKVTEIYDEEGTKVVRRIFTLPVPKSIFENGEDIYYMIKYRDGYVNSSGVSHDGDWYKASSGDYYLTGYTLEYVSDSTDLPGDEPAAEPIVFKEDDITNNTGMFKVVAATALENADGSVDLTFALSGTGYHWLYKGTYEEALAANEAIAAGIAADTGSDKLIRGSVNDDDLWEFRMKINADELGKEVAVVAISDSYYQKFLNGQNSQERSYYPRQLNLNLDETKLVTGDFDMTYEFTLTTELADFKAASPVTVHILGGPNSNNYKVEPTFVMGDATYDMVEYPTVVGSAVSTATAELTDGKFAISMLNAPNKAAFKDKTPLEFMFHVAADAPYEDAGMAVVRNVTFDQVARTITVEGIALTPKETPSGEHYVVSANVTKTSPEGAAFTMFIPNLSGATVSGDPDDNKVNLIIDEEGTYTLQFTNYKTSYPAIYMGTLTEGQNPDTFDASKLKVGEKEGSIYSYNFTIDASLLGTSFPIALAKKASPGSANSDWYTTQLYMTLGSEKTPIDVYNVIKQIDALPAATDVTIRDKEAIEAARAAYDALTDEQKAQVTNLDKLVAAEEAYAALPEKDEQTVAVETAIAALIQQYYDVNDTTAAAVTDARTAYNALTAQQQAYIDDATYHKLVRAEACVAFVNDDSIAEGMIVDTGVDTSAEGPFIAATISPRTSAAYLYLYSVADQYTGADKVSGTVSKSTHKLVGNNTILKGLWQVQTTEGQGREFVIKLTGANGNSEDINVKVPGVYGTMTEGTYEVAAIQDPSSKMRKFERSTITSDGTAMTAEFVMPNTSYGKIFLGTAEAAAAATEGFIEPTGTEATSGTTGTGNVYTIPLESMYQPIIVSYFLTSKETWTQETVEFVADEQSQAVIDAIAALNLNTYFNVTADQREQVDAAAALYEQLDENQKANLDNSNYGTLKKVLAMFKIADIVAAEIEALPDAENVTSADVDAIREVKADFDNMGKSDIIKEALGQKPDGTWNTLQNSQIEKLISQELKDKLNSCVGALADYSAVDAALAKVPEDLSIYTEDSANALTEAVNAVDRSKLASEQEEVDAMAEAIEDAFKGLVVIPAEVTFTLNFKGTLAADKDGELVVERPVTVTDLDEDKYLTYDEALIAAHEAYFEGGAEAGYTCDGYVTKLWGEDTSNTLFMLNGEGIPTGVTADTVKTGDTLYASVNADGAYYADWYTQFSETEMNAAAGKDITVHLTGHLGMAYTDEDKAFVPLEGIQIGYVVDGEFKPIEGAVTDKDGNATFKFEETGSYLLTAEGTVEDVVTDWNLMMLGNNVPPYGTIDFDTYESSVAYTDEDYGDGPYPAAEVKFIDFYEEAAEGSDNRYAWQDLHYLKSNQLIADCPIMAPYANVKVETAYTPGWHKIDGGWYYYDKDGNMVTDKWEKDSKGWCYLGEDGKMVTNDWAKDSKGWVYVGSDGYMVTGTKWMKVDGAWYHITNGYRDQSKWMKDSKGWCYLAADGKMVTNGWAKDSKGYCWIGSDGYMVEQTKWIKVDGIWYHITNGYRDQSKWMKDSKGWCYVGPDGKMVTNNFVPDSKGQCYIGSDGYMLDKTQWIEVDGTRYYIKSGYMAVNTWAKDDSGWMYLGSDGLPVTKTWKKDSKGWCYVGEDGYMVTNDWAKDSKGYCWIGPNGYMIEETMLIEFEGNTYGIKDGYMVVNGSLEINGTTYNFGSDGKLVP